jgi:hypothetical protein
VQIKVPEPDKVFDQFKIHRIVVLVRSDYFDPEGKKTISNTYILYKDDTEQDLLFHLWDEASGGDNRILYEYRIGVETTDGSQFSQKEWNKPDELFQSSITVGANAISAMMSEEGQE